MAILVTGAHGGLGTALVKQILDQDILTPTRSECDLLNAESVQTYIRRHRPKKVVHLASLVYGLKGNIDNYFNALNDNTIINANLFAALNQNPPEYIFFAGTVASYPFPYPRMPLYEDDFFLGLPHAGEFGYAMAKRHAFAYLDLLKKNRCVRFNYGIFTNMYGEHDKFNSESGHVIPSLIAKAYNAKINGSQFDVWGDGSATRDFLHFEDAARAIVLCLETEVAFELLNISSGQASSIKFCADTICKAAGIESVCYLEDKPVGISSRTVSNVRLKQLGFQQKISLTNGLRNLFGWYEANFGSVRN
jgi:GDP-L-fucose synthase